MKHTLKVTFFLFIIFLCAQAAGLAIINEYIDIRASMEEGKTVINKDAYSITGIQPPEVKNESVSWVYIMSAVLLGTGLVLLIIRFGKTGLWKLWFFVSVLITLSVSLAPFIIKALRLAGLERLGLAMTLIIACTLAVFKIFRPNIFIHNLTEIFIYGGLAALVVPMINLTSAVVILILISGYDAFAVWQSKHMVKMAKFQTRSKIFAGLLLSYDKPIDKVPAKRSRPGNKPKGSSAILGGGDIAFPLLFSGVILKTTASFPKAFIISLSAGVALFLLLIYGKRGRFYPAMPFISAGCFIGYGITHLL